MTARLRELAERLDMLVDAVTKANWSEFSMRVPAEPSRDADLVMAKAAVELRAYAAILDADGDGGASREGWKLGIAVLQSDLYEQLSEEDRAVCDALIQENPYINTTRRHPTRSNEVSDADANALKMNLYPMLENTKLCHIKDALEHFSKRTQVCGDELFTNPPCGGDSSDTSRMDWLVSHDVEVRDPRLHGSTHLFTAQTTSDEEDDFYRTSLREQIDAARKGERHE